jgi:hypothetical protein
MLKVCEYRNEEFRTVDFLTTETMTASFIAFPLFLLTSVSPPFLTQHMVLL